MDEVNLNFSIMNFCEKKMVAEKNMCCYSYTHTLKLFRTIILSLVLLHFLGKYWFHVKDEGYYEEKGQKSLFASKINIQ